MRRYDWERLIFCMEASLEFKAVAWAMAQFANGDGSHVRPGRELIGDGVGRSGRQVSDYTAAMTAMGLLTVTSRGGGRGGAGSRTVYQLSMPAAGGLPMRLELDKPHRRVAPRQPGRTPIAALAASTAKRFEVKPASPHSGANEVKPSSAESPNEVKPVSPQTANDVKPASHENDFQRNFEADWEEPEPPLRGTPEFRLPTDQSDQTPVSTPLDGTTHQHGRADASAPGGAIAPPPADPALSPEPTYPAAARFLNELDPDIADWCVRTAAQQLRSEGREPTLRPLTIRAALIAHRTDPPGPDLPDRDPEPDYDEGL
jgi:hypothetical protein